MYRPDLSRFRYLPGAGWAIVSVGWLDARKKYPRGEVAASDVRLLEQLLLHGWQPVSSKGFRGCNFCGDPSQPTMREIAGKRRLLGADILFVPADGCMYAAPSLIIHYIEAHQYLPPQAFLTALRGCQPQTDSYRKNCEKYWGVGFFDWLFGR